MSFRSNKSGNKGKWDKNASIGYPNNIYDEAFRRENSYFKKGSYQPYGRTKDTVEDTIGNIGNALNSVKSSKKAFLPDNMLELSRASFYQETSILQTKNSKITGLYDELNAKQEQIQALKTENQCLKLLLQNQVKRMDEENYQKIGIQEQQIEHLTNKIKSLKAKGCMVHPRSNLNQYQLQLQDHIAEINSKLQEAQQYKEELSSIITKLYRENLISDPQPSRLIPNSGSSTSLKSRIQECLLMLDQLVR